MNIRLCVINAIAFLLSISCHYAFASDYVVGPAGGTGGTEFQTHLNSNEWVCGVYVRHAKRIDAIQLKVCDNYGNSYRSQKFGGNGGSESYFEIKNDEFFAGAVVYLTYKDGNQRVAGLTLTKQKKISRPRPQDIQSETYGTKATQAIYDEYHNSPFTTRLPFYYYLPGIRGIWGRSGSELDALGFIFSQEQTDMGWHTFLGNQTRIAAGGSLGIYYDSFQFTEKLCKVKINHGQRIDSIQFSTCSQNRITQTSKLFGGNGGSSSTFSLAQDEYITAIKGSTIKRGKLVRFSSIQILTNKRASPVYGVQTSSKFNLSIPKGQELTGVIANYYDELFRLELISE